jgi:hypothetical protein
MQNTLRIRKMVRREGGEGLLSFSPRLEKRRASSQRGEGARVCIADATPRPSKKARTASPND